MSNSSPTVFQEGLQVGDDVLAHLERAFPLTQFKSLRDQRAIDRLQGAWEVIDNLKALRTNQD
jgi:hypothetical protein